MNLRCSGAVPPTCTVSPSPLTPTAAGAAFTVSVASDTQNHFNFTIDATGTDAAHIHQSTPVELIVGFNFVINNNSAGQTIKAGQTASYNLDVAPLGNGSVFPGNVSLSCGSAGLPPLSACTFTPSQVASGQGDTNVVLKVVTTAPSPATANLGAPPHLLGYDMALSLTGLVLALGGVRQSRRRRLGWRIGILSLLLGLAACGGSSTSTSGNSGGGSAGHPGTPSGNYTITITGTVGSVTRTVQVALTVQ